LPRDIRLPKTTATWLAYLPLGPSATVVAGSVPIVAGLARGLLVAPTGESLFVSHSAPAPQHVEGTSASLVPCWAFALPPSHSWSGLLAEVKSPFMGLVLVSSRACGSRLAYIRQALRCCQARPPNRRHQLRADPQSPAPPSGHSCDATFVCSRFRGIMEIGAGSKASSRRQENHCAQSAALGAPGPFPPLKRWGGEAKPSPAQPGRMAVPFPSCCKRSPSCRRSFHRGPWFGYLHPNALQQPWQQWE